MKTYNGTNLTLNLWEKKKSQRKNSNPSESLLTKKLEGTLFSWLYIPSSFAHFFVKIKNQKSKRSFY